MQRSDYPSANGARGITSADFNRDGWIDIAVANHNPDGISVLLNQRGAGFGPSFIPQSGGPFEITTGDLNNDAIPDIVVANADGNMINVAFGLPGGGFRTPLQIGAMGNPRGVTVADMDRDGNEDIVYTQYYFRGVQILYGDGQGNFDNRTIGAATVGDAPQGVVAADFNMDGRIDIAVASSGSVGLTVLTRQAAGNYARQDVPGPQQLNVLTVGDFNSDGRPDIAAASSAANEIAIYLNLLVGWQHSATLAAGTSPRDIIAVDLNRDGALDLVTGNRGSSTMVAHLGTGAGGFPARVEVPVGAGGRVVAVADYNNDGRIDVATGNEYAATVSVLTNVTPFPPSAFAFRESQIGTPGTIWTTASTTDVADFDGDGKLDVVTQSNQGITVIRGNGATTTHAAQGFPNDLKTGDFNNDGRSDILILNRPTSGNATTTLTTFLGNGAGGFTPISTQTNIRADQLEVGDLNHDGKLDAVLASDFGAIVQVALGNGDGRFTFGGYLYPNDMRSRVTLADINRDGYLDIAIFSQDEGPSQVVDYRLNNRMAQPSFDTAGSISFDRWSMIQDAKFGDVNHDGYLDAVAIGGYTETLGVALGGPEGFGAARYFAVGANVYPFELVDITLDGHLDVVTGAGEIIAGAGDGTFTEAQRFTSFGLNLQVVDYNRDGLPDVVHAGSIGSVIVKLNQRTGTNTNPTVSAGPDRTFPYDQQFFEQEFGPMAFGSDEDLHRLTYQWTDAEGRVLSNHEGLFLNELRPGRHEFFVTVSDGRGGSARDSVVYTVTPVKEIVLHVVEGSVSQGNWGYQADNSAAFGYVLRDIDTGAPKVTVPLANPSSFSEFAFHADPTQTYKLWVRLKASGDRWSNDSLWLQFSGAVDQNGRAFQPGTTSGIEVNLEECSGCGISGWGWRDDAWGQAGAMSALTLRFPRGGYQTIRIQTREDGVAIDQLVLSAERYLKSRPGTVKNDTTIVPATRRFED